MSDQSKGGEASATARCVHCQAALSPSHSGPCPQCGGVGKDIFVTATSTIGVTTSYDLIAERREIIRIRPWIRWVLLAFDLASLGAGFFIGQWLGFFIGLILVIIGEAFGPRTIERITRDHQHGN